MNRVILGSLIGFVTAWAIILLFDAWRSLHWPNPLEWDELSRVIALYLSMCGAGCAGIAAWFRGHS